MRNNFFVFDTNTLISAFVFRSSNPRKAFEKAVKEGEIFASLKTFDELSEVLLRPKFDKYISPANKLVVLKQFRELAVFSDPLEVIRACRDFKDNKFLELAVSASASCIITGDKDLLILHPFRNISILNASDFLNTF
jgi:putative PIN family toxin of toxin-antitoxin system